MSFMLKSSSLLKRIEILAAGLLICVLGFWSVLGTVWTPVDFQVLDLFYKRAVKLGYAPARSPQIVYLSLTNETYRYFGKNFLDRADLAQVNEMLVELGPEAVAYDIIFTRPSNPASDQYFAESIRDLDCVYLPIAFRLSAQKPTFRWGEGQAYEQLRTKILKQPVEQGRSRPLFAAKALLQLDDFSEVAYNSGHVNAPTDPGGVHRHQIMLINVDSQYVPTLSLAMFLDYAGVSFDEVIVNWGNEIRIPATQESYLDEDVVIPIDEQGRAFIPFAHVWGQDFDNMSVHNFLEYAKDINLQGNLTEFFEGKFVFIGDVSQGATDIGHTPLEQDVPLIAIHTALLNGLLTNTFYYRWTFARTLLLIAGIAITLALSALPRASKMLYATGCVILVSLIGFTWFQFTRFALFPIVTVGGSFLFLFVGLVVSLQIATSKEQAFIRDAFAKFVPETVVEELLGHPEKLTLGGEAREVTVLFCDLQGFTTIAERLSPQQLVQLLNEYLSEMTKIIIAEGGIVDKYLGDGIMAEFGAPLPVENHADMAVSAALKIQRCLHELRQNWAEQGLPELKCRIGINTGMVIIGNMGSDRVFDYTVIGDAANLASRLEGANKLYDTFLMISESTYNALTPDRFRTRTLDVIKVKGKFNAVKVFEVYGENSDSTAVDEIPYYQTYQAAFDTYLSRNFTLALERFALALQLRPDDPAARWMISRIASLSVKDLPEDWDGSVQLTSK